MAVGRQMESVDCRLEALWRSKGSGSTGVQRRYWREMERIGRASSYTRTAAHDRAVAAEAPAECRIVDQVPQGNPGFDRDCVWCIMRNRNLISP
jgi:hypothetical protein